MFNIKNLFRVNPDYTKIMADCTEQLREIIKLNQKINMLDKANQNLQASISGNKAVITRQRKEIVGLRQENKVLKEENKKLSPRDPFEEFDDNDKIVTDIPFSEIETGKIICDILKEENKLQCTYPHETECHAHNGIYCMNGIVCNKNKDEVE